MQLAGREWFSRPEFHVTTFTTGDVAREAGLPEARLDEAAEELRDELTAVRPIRFDGRVARVRDDQARQTLVAFCDVDGLEDVLARLALKVGRPLPRPPTHVTLYTAEPGMAGIGLSTQAQVQARAVLLPARDGAKVLEVLAGAAVDRSR